MDASPHELAVPIERMSLRQKLGIYTSTITTHPARLPLEQLVFLVASWVPTGLGVALRALLYPLIVRTGFPVLVEKNVTLHRPGAIRLGRNVFVGENVYMLAGGHGISIGDHCEILPNCVLMIRDYRGVPNAGIEIGHHVGINTGAIIFSHGRTRIGDDVLIGPGAVISTSGHTFEDGTRPIRMQRIAVGDIDIGAGAWIGARAVVLPGVRIGEGAVVAAGAVAAEDVPPYSLAVGVPARVVRSWAPGAAAGRAVGADAIA